MKYPLKKIALVVEGKLYNASEEYVDNIITDSRRVYQTTGTLFVALQGPNHDGHKYIPELIKKGIRSFIVEKSYSFPADIKSSCFIKVPNTLDAFQRLAAFHRQSFTGKVLAITGSNGKTVVKEWLAQLLSGVHSVAKSPKSYNSQVGVPISVLQMEPGPQYHILEAGISLPSIVFRTKGRVPTATACWAQEFDRQAALER